MKKIPFHATTGLPCEVPPRFTRITRLMHGMTAILMALLFQGIGEVRGQISQGSYGVKLSWNASVSKDVTGYRIHYGSTSRTYTGSIVFGNVTSGMVSGLAVGVPYHFSVSAINSAGVESDFSNEVAFTPGKHTSKMRTSENGKIVLFVRGLIGAKYDIEASQDLKTWAIISTVTMPEGGWLEFADPKAGNHPRRYYRTRLRP